MADNSKSSQLFTCVRPGCGMRYAAIGGAIDRKCLCGGELTAVTPKDPTIELAVGDHLRLQLKENELEFLRKHAEISAQATADTEALKRCYAAHLAAGGAKIYYRDGREILSDA